MNIDQASPQQLRELFESLQAKYTSLQAEKLSLDLTRGKPAIAQLELASDLDGILQGNYHTRDGAETRNYANVWGIPEARELGGEVLDIPASNVLAGGNSSLTLMFFTALTMMQYGVRGEGSAWNTRAAPKFICPVPGYDRHFSICENLGIKMITVPMLDTGPDMDAVEALIKADSDIVGMWCVPKYSNPTGCVYSDETVDRIAALGKIANPDFRVLWDNAYAVHDLVDNPPELASLWARCEAHGTTDHVFQFASSSKITFAGGGIAWVGSSRSNLECLAKQMGVAAICFDQVNQLRHTKLIPDMQALKQLMKRHCDIIAPKFDTTIAFLERELSDGYGEWLRAQGGYFVAFDARPGLAKTIVKLAADAGVKLTPAGATFPYGKDPNDQNIRIAPSFPLMADLEKAMDVFVTCVKLATVQQMLD